MRSIVLPVWALFLPNTTDTLLWDQLPTWNNFLFFWFLLSCLYFIWCTNVIIDHLWNHLHSIFASFCFESRIRGFLLSSLLFCLISSQEEEFSALILGTISIELTVYVIQMDNTYFLKIVTTTTDQLCMHLVSDQQLSRCLSMSLN